MPSEWNSKLVNLVARSNTWRTQAQKTPRCSQAVSSARSLCRNERVGVWSLFSEVTHNGFQIHTLVALVHSLAVGRLHEARKYVEVTDFDTRSRPPQRAYGLRHSTPRARRRKQAFSCASTIEWLFRSARPYREARRLTGND